MFEPFQNLVNKSSKSPKVWISTEDCKLCKEHCVQVDVKKRRELVDWPELPYPGDDASCVGYCPGNQFSSYLIRVCTAQAV